jgi:hypothetical protein
MKVNYIDDPYYILVRGGPHVFELDGWTDRDHFLREGQLNPVPLFDRQRECWGIHRSKLRPMASLFSAISPNGVPAGKLSLKSCLSAIVASKGLLILGRRISPIRTHREKGVAWSTNGSLTLSDRRVTFDAPRVVGRPQRELFPSGGWLCG